MAFPFPETLWMRPQAPDILQPAGSGLGVRWNPGVWSRGIPDVRPSARQTKFQNPPIVLPWRKPWQFLAPAPSWLGFLWILDPMRAWLKPEKGCIRFAKCKPGRNRKRSKGIAFQTPKLFSPARSISKSKETLCRAGEIDPCQQRIKAENGGYGVFGVSAAFRKAYSHNLIFSANEAGIFFWKRRMISSSVYRVLAWPHKTYLFLNRSALSMKSSRCMWPKRWTLDRLWA